MKDKDLIYLKEILIKIAQKKPADVRIVLK